jgi:hypothetical protein
MKIAIMQPYLFPYIGYFQLINAADKFAIYSHVQYIKKGWINRNKILVNNHEKLFSFSIRRGSYTDTIKQTYFSPNVKTEFSKFLIMLHFSYKKAPFFYETYNLIEEILNYDDLNVSNFILNSLRKMCGYLNIQTPILELDSIENASLDRSERVIILCNLMESKHYINSIGGVELYDKTFFKDNGIILNFIKTRSVEYNQFGNIFVPNLSIIDIMMFNSIDRIHEMLNNFELI